MDDRKKLTRSYYEPRVRSFSKGYEIHDWEDNESQYARFNVLLDAIELAGCSLLDVGCGIGDLYAYLNVTHKLSVRYTGVDLLDAMVSRAQSRFPEGNFLAADLTSDSTFEPESFDVVYCSGVFNLKIGDHDQFAHTMIPVLAKLAAKHLVFNMLHINSPDRNDRYCYFDPDDVVQWDEISALSPRIVSGYLPNDFSIVCTRP